MLKVEDIQTVDDASTFVEGCINDLEAGIATKEETMSHLGKYTGRLMELFWNNALKIIRENPELLNKERDNHGKSKDEKR